MDGLVIWVAAAGRVAQRFINTGNAGDTMLGAFGDG